MERRCVPNQACLEHCPVLQNFYGPRLDAVQSDDQALLESGMSFLDQVDNVPTVEMGDAYRELAERNADIVNDGTADKLEEEVVDLSSKCSGPQRKINFGRIITWQLYVCNSESPLMSSGKLKGANSTLGEAVVDEVRSSIRKIRGID
jgi:hypothetical protein